MIEHGEILKCRGGVYPRPRISIQASPRAGINPAPTKEKLPSGFPYPNFIRFHVILAPNLPGLMGGGNPEALVNNFLDQYISIL